MSASLGYARVSTSDQDLAGQVMRLEAAGAARNFEDVISGRTFDRPGLKALLDYARVGDALMVVRLDRLGRSLRELLDVVAYSTASDRLFQRHPTSCSTDIGSVGGIVNP